MILLDANVLLYAKIKSFPEHQIAVNWFDEMINSGQRVGLPWETLIAFCRISTNARIFSKPLSIESAWQQVAVWLDIANVWIPIPGDGHSKILGSLVPECKGAPGLIHDAHLAALAIEHGLIVCSADGDFARFKQVRWQNPLQAKNQL